MSFLLDASGGNQCKSVQTKGLNGVLRCLEFFFIKVNIKYYRYCWSIHTVVRYIYIYICFKLYIHL